MLNRLVDLSPIAKFQLKIIDSRLEFDLPIDVGLNCVQDYWQWHVFEIRQCFEYCFK